MANRLPADLEALWAETEANDAEPIPWLPGGGSAQNTHGEILHGAYTRFLAETDWDAFITLTYAVEPNVRSARRMAENFWTRIGARDAFWVTERGTRFNRVHNHALVTFGNSDPETVRAIHRPWWSERVGRIDWQHYDPALGAVGYLGSYATKKMEDWDLWQAKPKSSRKRIGWRETSPTPGHLIPPSPRSTESRTRGSGRRPEGARRKSYPGSAVPTSSAISIGVGSGTIRVYDSSQPGSRGTCRRRNPEAPGR